MIDRARDFDYPEEAARHAISKGFLIFEVNAQLRCRKGETVYFLTPVNDGMYHWELK